MTNKENPDITNNLPKGTAVNPRKKLMLDDLDEKGLSGDELERGKSRKSRGPRKPGKEDGQDVSKLMRLVSVGIENLTPEEQKKLEEQKNKLHYLLGKGKERGYVTNAEINDHLPAL